MIPGFLFILGVSFTIADLFGNIANIILTVGSSIKNSFYLRFAIVLGGIFEVIYYFQVAENPLWTSIIWAVVIITLNVYFIAIIYYEKYTLDMDEEEKRIYYSLFSNMDIGLFHKFIKLSKKEELESKKFIIEEGKFSDKLHLLLDGMAEVIVDNHPVAFIHNGTFVGEMSFLSGKVPTATVKTTLPSKLITWRKHDVKKLSESDSGFEKELQQVLSTDIILKLTKQNRAEN
jgi:Popeye-like protein